jgi:hypothetical protein
VARFLLETLSPLQPPPTFARSPWSRSDPRYKALEALPTTQLHGKLLDLERVDSDEGASVRKVA